MKTKIDSKRPPASSSDTSSDSSSSEDEAPKSTTKAVAPAKVAQPKQLEKPAAKSNIPKATPAKEAIPPKPVPANKFPKKAASSSSDSSGSSSESDSDSPPAKRANVGSTPKSAATNNIKPVANNAKSTPQVNNNKAAKPAPPAVQQLQSQPKANLSPKHVATPVRNAPAPAQTVLSPRRDVPPPAPTPVKRAFNQSAPVTAATEEEPCQRVQPKKLVTSVFGSSCPHCGHDIEVKVKFS